MSDASPPGGQLRFTRISGTTHRFTRRQDGMQRQGQVRTSAGRFGQTSGLSSACDILGGLPARGMP
jgi:hypothetical protein